LAWKIEFSEGAKKSLSKLDKSIASRLLYFLEKRVAGADDPRSLGQARKGSELGEFWKYRVGDWRLICSIQDETITVYVVKIGNRREVYR
jgi:mRNA interferase RelE/StbE